MNCMQFTVWLDGGRSASDRAPALAHASSCSHCARALAASDAVERMLAAPPAPAPAGFSDRVMRRVATARRSHAVHAFDHPVDWWVRVAAEPAAVLAMILAALLAWRGEVLLRVAPLVTNWAAAAAVSLHAAAPQGLEHASRTPLIALAFALAALPIVLWISWRAFVWVERACVPAHLTQPATDAA
jgi:hypothetical protein